METIRLGKSEVMVSRLGFGGIPIQRLSEDNAVSVVRRCLDLGVTFIDTANGYTTSEERIGKAVSGRRQNVVIASKTMARTPEDFEKHLSLTLTRLGVDYVDLYQFHGVSDFKTLETIYGLLPMAEAAKKAGKIRHIGITSHQMDVAQKAVQSDHFETVMFPFNFLASEAETELLPLCRTHDVGFINMKPMAGGMVDNASVAIKFLLQFPDIVVLPGIERIEEIEEIASIFAGPQEMTAADLAEMERLKAEVGQRFCHRCDYCQPCTEEIPISVVLSAKSFFKRLPPEGFFGSMVVPAMKKAAMCSKCGNCEERCPYHLPIRDMISEYVDWFERECRHYEERAMRQK
jgi:uncharacterized protein